MDTKKIGPLLSRAIERVEKAESLGMVTLAAAHAGSITDDERLPVVIQLPRKKPDSREAWSNYRSRMYDVLGEITNKVQQTAGIETTPLITANALRADASVRQLDVLTEIEGIRVLELDPILQIVMMDDAVEDVQLVDSSNY
jgi:hypothetical protein